MLKNTLKIVAVIITILISGCASDYAARIEPAANKNNAILHCDRSPTGYCDFTFGEIEKNEVRKFKIAVGSNIEVNVEKNSEPFCDSKNKKNVELNCKNNATTTDESSSTKNTMPAKK